MAPYLYAEFFFSSRRRHTRWNCDWSSDVCSSDLEVDASPLFQDSDLSIGQKQIQGNRDVINFSVTAHLTPRSEERRVGKECRCQRSRGSEKKVCETYRGLS